MQATPRKPTPAEPIPRPTTTTTSKLHKPPQQSPQPKHKPRNRLQKRAATLPILPSETRAKALFVLEHVPLSRPSAFLGVYSTIDAVTAGAFKHGAHAFSREGLLDGSEYLCPTGRIKIRAVDLQTGGVSAAVVERSGDSLRLDIPHPEGQGERDLELEQGDGEKVFLGVHESATNAFCIGVFATKGLAWGACLKDKAWLAWSDELVEEERSVGEGNMPRLRARVVGSGRVEWFVKGCVVDSPMVVKITENKEEVVQQTALFDEQGAAIGQPGVLPPGCRDV